MLLSLPVEQIIKELKHDGSEEYPNGKKKAWSSQEIIDVALEHRLALVEIHAHPVLVEGNQEHEVYHDPWRRFLYYLRLYEGLLEGEYAVGKNHMVAWSGEKMYDPRGFIALMDDPNTICPVIFYAAIPF